MFRFWGVRLRNHSPGFRIKVGIRFTTHTPPCRASRGAHSEAFRMCRSLCLCLSLSLCLDTYFYHMHTPIACTYIYSYAGIRNVSFSLNRFFSVSLPFLAFSCQPSHLSRMQVVGLRQWFAASGRVTRVTPLPHSAHHRLISSPLCWSRF